MAILPQSPTRHRAGCFSGCLRIVGILALGCVLLLALIAVFRPWGFYLGGTFHPLAYWQGWGTIHAPEGDYVVLLSMSPWMRQGRRTPSVTISRSGPRVSGSGAVCSPHGETYDSLQLTGGFERRGVGVNTDGEPMTLSLSQRLNMLGTNSQTRLSLAFRGAWRNPELVLEEQGSLRRMFNADGTLYAGEPGKRPASGTPLPLTLHEGSRSEFAAACAAAKKR
jgi:hypothetical protein